MKTIIIIANLILTLVFGACSSKEQDTQGQAQAATIRKFSPTLNASHSTVLSTPYQNGRTDHRILFPNK